MCYETCSSLHFVLGFKRHENKNEMWTVICCTYDLLDNVLIGSQLESPTLVYLCLRAALHCYLFIKLEVAFKWYLSLLYWGLLLRTFQNKITYFCFYAVHFILCTKLVIINYCRRKQRTRIFRECTSRGARREAMYLPN